VTPTSSIGRSFALSVIITGVVGLGLVGGAILSPFLEHRIDRALGHMSRVQREQLDGHIILLGYSAVTKAILAELNDRTDAVVVTNDESDVSVLTDQDILVYVGDTDDEEALKAVRVETASAVFVATGSDASDALGVLTARQADPDVKIVATARDPENVPKFKRAGADVVVSLSSVLGRFMVDAALGNVDAEELAEEFASEIGTGDDRSTE
jgi:voltage-gated potassium channel